VKPRNIDNILKMEKLLADWCVNVDLKLAVAFHIRAAIFSENRINPIRLLKGDLIKAMKIVIDMNEKFTV
jgi:hypothetical protein